VFFFVDLLIIKDDSIHFPLLATHLLLDDLPTWMIDPTAWAEKEHL